jgi:hypothetical protein
MFFELFILIALVAAVVIGMRHGKPAAPDTPIIVQQPRQYHITLAPQLDFALGFVETLAQRLVKVCQPTRDTPTRYFQVSHKGAASQANGFYLLAVAFRKGIFFLQAISPLPLLHDTDSHLDTLRVFSDAVLLHYPPVPPIDEGGAGRIDAVIEEVAQQSEFVVSKLVA